jgi:hypothetical protein
MKLRQHFRSHNLSQVFSQLIRAMAPTLVALTFAGVAHAQGTMDFSGAQTLMGTFKTLSVLRYSRADQIVPRDRWTSE